MKISNFWGINLGSACNLLSCWFLAWFILRLWRRRRHIPPRHRLAFNWLHVFIPQNSSNFSRIPQNQISLSVIPELLNTDLGKICATSSFKCNEKWNDNHNPTCRSHVMIGSLMVYWMRFVSTCCKATWFLYSLRSNSTRGNALVIISCRLYLAPSKTNIFLQEYSIYAARFRVQISAQICDSLESRLCQVRTL
jgi:hypothetical protein